MLKKMWILIILMMVVTTGFLRADTLDERTFDNLNYEN